MHYEKADMKVEYFDARDFMTESLDASSGLASNGSANTEEGFGPIH